MAHVRTNGDNVKTTLLPILPFSTVIFITRVIAIGIKLSIAEATTNTVVLNALLSFANLLTSSLGRWRVLIIFLWRHVLRYKIK